MSEQAAEAAVPMEEETTGSLQDNYLDPTRNVSPERTSKTVPVLWQASVRNQIAPFLSPPVTRAIQQWDPVLEPYVGPEATITLGTSLLVAWFILWLVHVTMLSTGGGRAIDDADGDVLTKNADTGGERYDSTVLLMGPRNSGKTRLFYHLCYAERNIPTLMSLKANVGISTWTEREGSIDVTKAVRYMDWPGYVSLLDPEIASIIRASIKTGSVAVRLVVVIDATQPVTSAADTLDQLLQLLAEVHNKRGTTKPIIFIACHKNDLSNAKNERRLKIQVRTELERLLSLRAASSDPDAVSWHKTGQPLELDELGFVSLHFALTTCAQESQQGLAELERFCRTGEVS